MKPLISIALALMLSGCATVATIGTALVVGGGIAVDAGKKIEKLGR